MLNRNLSKVKIIAFTTFREIIKSKILINTIFLGFFILLATFVAYSFTYGEPDRIALDFGLGMLSLSSIGISIFIGVNLLAKEIESRTVYMIISRPVPRFIFLIGKLCGLAMVLILNILILSIMTLALYFFIGGEYSPLISWNILFIIIESLMVLLLVCFLSLVSTQTISVIFTICIYIVGQAIRAAQEVSFTKGVPFLTELLEIYHFVLPGFYKLNIKDFVLYKESLPYAYLTGSLAYGFFYSVFLLLISILVFEKKNLN